MLKKIFSHTAIYGLAPQITLVINFLLLPFITANLTELDYGVHGTMIAYTTALSALASLGLRVNIANVFFKSPIQYKWAWRQYYGFLNLWNILYGIILGTMVYFVIPDEALEHRWLILFLTIGPFILMGQTALIGRTYYQLSQKPIPIAVRSLIFGVLTALFNYIFIVIYKMGYMGWFWSAFISTFVSNLSYWLPLNFKLGFRPIYNFKRRFIKRSLKISLPTIPHYYSGYLLNSSDMMIMDQLNVNTQNIGKYNAANTFGTLANGFSTAIGWAVGPILLSKYKEKNDLEARNIIFMLQLIFFLVTFIGCLWLKEIFAFMIRNEFLSQMYPLGILLIMSINYRPMYLGSNNKLMYYEKTNIIWKLTFVAGIINVVLNLIFIPIYGFEAAAYTTFIAFLYMGYAGYYYKVFKEIEHINYYPVFWLILSIVLCISAYFLVEVNWVIKILISTFYCTGIIFYIFKLNKKIKI